MGIAGIYDGETISASVLSTRDDAQTILTNSQIIGDESLGQGNHSYTVGT
jgi:predicted ATP-grasp superfamily ATP-dependent carboligase